VEEYLTDITNLQSFTKGEPGPLRFVSYSDFTVNSCDYFLSQPGLFSAKLTPELVNKI